MLRERGEGECVTFLLDNYEVKDVDSFKIKTLF